MIASPRRRSSTPSRPARTRAGRHRHAARLHRARRLRRLARQRRRRCCAGDRADRRRCSPPGAQRGWPIVHTREAHRPDLSDCPPAKRLRGKPTLRIGDAGPMGRILVAGEPGTEIIPALAPKPGEIVDRQARQGHVLGHRLHEILQARGITHLVFTGVTTEVCVQTSMREANDRGYDCLLVEDGTESYFPEFKAAALAMIARAGRDRRLARAVGGAAAGDRGRGRRAPRRRLAALRVAPGPALPVTLRKHVCGLRHRAGGLGGRARRAPMAHCPDARAARRQRLPRAPDGQGRRPPPRARPHRPSVPAPLGDAADQRGRRPAASSASSASASASSSPSRASCSSSST